MPCAEYGRPGPFQLCAGRLTGFDDTHGAISQTLLLFQPSVDSRDPYGHVVELQKSSIDIALISGRYSCHCTTLGFPGVINALEEDVLSGMVPQSPEALLTAELGFS